MKSSRWISLFFCALVGAAAAAAAAASNPSSAVLAAPPPRGETVSADQLSAPPLASTATTILLLWERFPAETTSDFEIFRDGIVVGRTKKLCYTATQLKAGHRYRFSIQALDATGRSLGQTREIEATTKPAGLTLDVRQRGAVGDGHHEDTPAIQQAIKACPPGGTVLFPAGDYLVDHLELKSDLTLYLSAGATLRFLGRDEGHYPQRTLEVPGPDGDVPIAYGALILGVRTNNVTITGEGTIQGNGVTWWPKPQQYRPKVLEVADAQNLLVQGITIEDPPSWNVHPVYVDHAVFSHVTLLKRSTAPGTNGDGLNPDSCRDVLIVDCQFGNQDDSIAIKSGKVLDGQPKRQRSCENIVVRDCRFDGTLAPGSHPLGIGVGSETCGGVRHVRVRDCEFINAASLLNLKSNRDRRGAIVEDIRVENCSYTNTVFPDEPWNRAPITIDMFYFNRPEDPAAKEAPSAATPDFRDIHFRNLTIQNPRGRAVYINGFAEKPLRDITFTKVEAKSRVGFVAHQVDGILLDHVVVVAAAGSDYEWLNVEHRRIVPANGP